MSLDLLFLLLNLALTAEPRFDIDLPLSDVIDITPELPA